MSKRRATDLAARFKAAATGPAEPAEPTEPRPRRRRARPDTPPSAADAPPRRSASRRAPAAAPQSRQRRQGPAAPSLDEFQLRGPGGKRTVLYLQPDVLEYLDQLRAAATAQGGRLDRSAIVTALVRRHRDGP